MTTPTKRQVLRGMRRMRSILMYITRAMEMEGRLPSTEAV